MSKSNPTPEVPEVASPATCSPRKPAEQVAVEKTVDGVDVDDIAPAAEPDSPTALAEAQSEAKQDAVDGDKADKAESIQQSARDAFQESGLAPVVGPNNKEVDQGPVGEIADARRLAEIHAVQGVDAAQTDTVVDNEDELTSAELLELARKFEGVGLNQAEHDRLMALRNEKILAETLAGEKF